MSDTKPPVLQGVLKMKCPHCGKGDVFVNKSIFPLKTCLRTHEACTKCGQEFTSKSNSAPGMNYALTAVAYILCFVAYALIFGLSYFDNSIYYALIASTIIVVLLQPWLMRISKVTYLYIFTRSNF